jgi:hypothetical protein
MEKSIAVLIGYNKLPNDNSSAIYRIEISALALPEWIANLTLLAKGHIDCILLNSESHSAKLALSDKRKMIYPHIVKEGGIPKLIVPATLLNSLLDMYLYIYRDGKTEIEHLDIEVNRVDAALDYQRYYFTFM